MEVLNVNCTRNANCKTKNVTRLKESMYFVARYGSLNENCMMM